MKHLLLMTLTSSLIAAPLVSGKVALNKELAAKAKGIRTLFVSLYDAHAQSPMPCAAAKIALEKDVEKDYVFALDDKSIMMMGCAEIPATFNLKAKLDKDGGAGRDASGDIIGMANGVKKGSTNILIHLEKAIE